MQNCIASKADDTPCAFKARKGFQTCGKHKSQEPLEFEHEFHFCQTFTGHCHRQHHPGCYCCEVHLPKETKTRDLIQSGKQLIDYTQPFPSIQVFRVESLAEYLKMIHTPPPKKPVDGAAKE